MDKVVDNWEVNAFLVNDGRSTWLRLSSVEKLFYKDGIGRMIVKTVGLNEMKLIDGLSDGFSLTARLTPVGDRSNPQNGRLFVRLTNCQVLQKWFNHFTVSDPTDMGLLAGYAYIKGDITIKWHEGEQDG